MPENRSVSAKHIVFVGAANLDETVRLHDALQPGESNRVHRTSSVGGVACNAALAACKLAHCHLIATLGQDQAGQSITDQLQGSDIECHFVHAGTSTTGQYTAVLDAQGELIIGLANTEIAETLSARTIADQLIQLEQPALIAFDTNLSSNCIAELCASTEQTTLVAIGVSPVKTMRLRECGNHIDYLFVNRSEAAMLAGSPATSALSDLSSALAELDFHQHVITDGAAEILVKSRNSVEYLAPGVSEGCPGSARQPSVNGAGDALAGASIAKLAAGLSLADSVGQFGIPAAATILNGNQNA